MSGGRGLGGLTLQLWQRAARQLARLFDGSCKIYRLELQSQLGVCFAGAWREAELPVGEDGDEPEDMGESLGGYEPEDMGESLGGDEPEDMAEGLGGDGPEDMGEDMAAAQEWPCHLDLRQTPPAGLPEDGSRLTGSGRLFLALSAPEPPAGSRLHIVQQGREYDLVCSGPVVKYPTHMELEVRFVPGSA